jgi:hypothetical protein
MSRLMKTRKITVKKPCPGALVDLSRA